MLARVSKEFVREYAQTLGIPIRLATEICYTIITTLEEAISPDCVINLPDFLYLQVKGGEIYYRVLDDRLRKVEKVKRSSKKTNQLATLNKKVRRFKMPELSLAEVVAQLGSLMDIFTSEAANQLNGNKSAGARARKASLQIGKLLKEFRSASVAGA